MGVRHGGCEAWWVGGGLVTGMVGVTHGGWVSGMVGASVYLFDCLVGWSVGWWVSRLTSLSAGWVDEWEGWCECCLLLDCTKGG